MSKTFSRPHNNRRLTCQGCYQTQRAVPLFYAVSLLLISIGGTTWAQVESSSLTGTVTDQQGRFVPHAKVRAIQAATGLHRETETTSQGNYELVDLPAGTFSVEISKDGFSIFHAERVEQIVGRTRTLNATSGRVGGDATSKYH